MRRREFLGVLGGAAAAWPFAVGAQRASMPVIGFVSGQSADERLRDAFRKALNASGYVEGQNALVDYHWLDGHYDRVTALMADLVHRNVAVIATPGFAIGAE